MEAYGWTHALFWVVSTLGIVYEIFLIILEHHLAKIENKLEKINQQMAQRGDDNNNGNVER